jgi:UDP-2,3-diacylglucosamine pyrophosphatase LpxH
MLILSISDLHLGTGAFLETGQINILEDFHEDQRFFEFVEYYSTGKYEDDHVHLVLNGDIFDLIQVQVEIDKTHVIDDEITTRALEVIAKGHPIFFDALKRFVKGKNKKLTFVVGNHDAGIDFPGPQKKFKEIIDGEMDFVRFTNIRGIHFEHGHRFEAINTVPTNKYYVKGPDGQDILNLPWGSLFCIHVLPDLKKERPFIDKVRPIGSYVMWCFLHDLRFFMYMAFKVIQYIFVTRFKHYTLQNANFRTTIKLLKQVTVYPNYARQAQRILRRKRKQGVHTVVMGHTHVAQWRKYPDGTLYFNSGTWNPIPSIDAGMHQSVTKLSYVSIRMHEKDDVVLNACLNTWKGNWSPFSEWIRLDNE